MSKEITLVYQPTVECIAEMNLEQPGIMKMAEWIKLHRPNCIPADGIESIIDLFPHGGFEASDAFASPMSEPDRYLSGNELLVELAGRKCYDSFAEQGKKATNREYIATTQKGPIPHASIQYHAKMSFFIAGVSRRVSHELIRNYVGADRDEEGSPSQESTRFTHHYGFYVVHPKIHGSVTETQKFREAMQVNYDAYTDFIDREVDQFKYLHNQEEPKGLERKRIYEGASSYLSHSCETSFIWTTNPMALKKLFKERCDLLADAEMQRFANKWKMLCVVRWPNLFQGLE